MWNLWASGAVQGTDFPNYKLQNNPTGCNTSGQEQDHQSLRPKDDVNSRRGFHHIAKLTNTQGKPIIVVCQKSRAIQIRRRRRSRKERKRKKKRAGLIDTIIMVTVIVKIVCVIPVVIYPYKNEQTW